MSDQELRKFVDGEPIAALSGQTAPLIAPPARARCSPMRLCRAKRMSMPPCRLRSAPLRPRATPHPASAASGYYGSLTGWKPRAGEFAEAESQGTGKPHELTRSEEIPPMVDQIRFFAARPAAWRANGVEFRLAPSVWTRDHGRAMRMAGELDFGCVWINTHIPLVAEMPHGGFKHSRYGKDLSMHGLEDYTRIKHVMTYLGS